MSYLFKLRIKTKENNIIISKNVLLYELCHLDNIILS